MDIVAKQRGEAGGISGGGGGGGGDGGGGGGGGGDGVHEDLRRMFTFYEIDYHVPKSPPSSVHAKWLVGLGVDEELVRCPMPRVRLYGRQRACDGGRSVCCIVHGFLPYCYAKVDTARREALVAASGSEKAACADIAKALTDAIRSAPPSAAEYTRGGGGGPARFRKTPSSDARIVASVKFVHRTDLYYYHADAEWFVHVEFLDPTHVARAAEVIRARTKAVAATDDTTALGVIVRGGDDVEPMYEANVDFVVRFGVDCGLPGCSWVSIDKPALTTRMANDDYRTTSCTVEIHAYYTALRRVDAVLESGPYSTLYLDIECTSLTGEFPLPGQDPVISIGCFTKAHGDDATQRRVVFALRGSDTIDRDDGGGDGGDDDDDTRPVVRMYDAEGDMLLSLRNFIVNNDFDVICGYNVKQFDLWYLYERARAIGVHETFFHMGRTVYNRMTVTESTFSNRAMGKKENKCIKIQGRVIFDLFVQINRDHKLRSYTLNSVARHFLKEEKDVCIVCVCVCACAFACATVTSLWTLPCRVLPGSCPCLQSDTTLHTARDTASCTRCTP